MVRRLLRLGAVLGVLLFTSQVGRAQDVLAEQQILGLRGLNSVYVVFSVSDKTKEQIFRQQDVANFVTVALARDVRKLKVSGDPKTAEWLEVSVVLRDNAAFIDIRVHRWVTLIGTRTDFFATAWGNSTLVSGGTLTMSKLKEAVQTLLTSFAADYIRANN
jgi:hypothetical protein